MAKKKNVKKKGKKQHRKSRKSQKWTSYKVNNGKIERVKKICVKCGSGVFMAEHDDRFTCGKCSYTIFKKE